EVLHEHRNRALVWGYLQMMIVVSIVATGAGLHVAGIFHRRTQAKIGPVATLLTGAVPVSVFLVSVYALYGLPPPGVRSPPSVAAGRQCGGGRACRHRGSVRVGYGAVPGGSHAGAGCHRPRL